MTKCDSSPTGEHWLITVLPPKKEYGVEPGTYCLRCKRKIDEDKKCGPYDDWPKDGH